MGRWDEQTSGITKIYEETNKDLREKLKFLQMELLANQR